MDVLYLVHTPTGDMTRAEVFVWSGSLAATTVADLHEWQANKTPACKFLLLQWHTGGGTLAPLLHGNGTRWDSTLAAVGVRSGSHVFPCRPEAFPLDAFASAASLLPLQWSRELVSKHKLQGTLVRGRMHLWAPATLKATAAALAGTDDAFAWRAKTLHMLARHVAVKHDEFAAFKAIKAAITVMGLLGVPQRGEEAVHALTVLLSAPAECSVRAQRLLRHEGFDAEAALTSLCATAGALTDAARHAEALPRLGFGLGPGLQPGAVAPVATTDGAAASAAVTAAAVASSVASAAASEDPDMDSGSSSSGSGGVGDKGSCHSGGAVGPTTVATVPTPAAATAALNQLVDVVRRTCFSGNEAPGCFYVMPDAVWPALAALFQRPFAVRRGVLWTVGSERPRVHCRVDGGGGGGRANGEGGGMTLDGLMAALMRG